MTFYNKDGWYNNIFGEGVNVFGAGPTSTQTKLATPVDQGGYGLLKPEELERAKKRSLTKGLLGTVVNYLAQPKNQGYGSGVPYIAKAFGYGMDQAEEAFSGLEDSVANDQKYQAVLQNKELISKLSADPRVQKDPILKSAVFKDPMGVYKVLNESKARKAPTQRKREAPVDEDGDGTPDYLETIYEEWDANKGEFVEISRSPKEILGDDVQMTDGAIDMAASGYVLDGTLPPMGRGKNARSDRVKILNRAEQLIEQAGGDPLEARLQARLNIQEFKAQEIALKNFSTGVEGRKVRSLNTAMHHLESMKEWSEALKNNDVRKVNAVSNLLATEIGRPEVTNFDFAKQIVADEVLVSVVQAGGSMQERLELQESFDSANSPEQLLGVIETAHELMAGQLQSLELQYNSSVGDRLSKRKPFVDKLSPSTRKLYDKFKIGGKTPEKVQLSEEDQKALDHYNSLPDGSATKKELEKILKSRKII